MAHIALARHSEGTCLATRARVQVNAHQRAGADAYWSHAWPHARRACIDSGFLRYDVMPALDRHPVARGHLNDNWPPVSTMECVLALHIHAGAVGAMLRAPVEPRGQPSHKEVGRRGIWLRVLAASGIFNRQAIDAVEIGTKHVGVEEACHQLTPGLLARPVEVAEGAVRELAAFDVIQRD